MYICVCHKVTDKQIQQAVDQGVCSLWELRQQLNVGTACGRCADSAREFIRTEESSLADFCLQPA